MIVDGKKIANEIVEALAAERPALPPKLTLGVLMGAQDAAAASFVKIKERVADRLHVVVVPDLVDQNSTTQSALRSLERLSTACNGVIVQLPLPKHIDIEEILKAIPADKDVDAINPTLGATMRHVRAPVAEAVSEIFLRYHVAAANKKALVVGSGRLVGQPAARLLRELGARVSVVTDSINLGRQAREADMVILGAGAAGILKPDMLKPGVILIDAGASESEGELAGDADPKCAEVASIFTPVPGGVGPIAVAMIFKNLFTLARHHGGPAKLAQK